MSVRLPPLVMHVLYRLDTGGLENGVVNLINHMPEQAYRHCIVSLTEATAFQQRIRRPDVEVIALHKPPGHALKLYPALWRLVRSRRPAIVHSRNLAALETQVPALLAGVPVRLHGEHGRDVDDLDGNNRKLQRIRRLYSPFVQRYVALSRDLAGYLEHKVGIVPARIAQIYNGVDADRFRPAPGGRRAAIAGCPFSAPGHWLVGTVGRMQTVKNQVLLARAFVLALRDQPVLRQRMRLVLVGDGPQREAARQILVDGGIPDLAWLPGERADVPDIMRGLDCFVLPSLAEGISNTILEAMASGLPVVATAVGGNPELVDHGRSGLIVPSDDVPAMAQALLTLAQSADGGAGMGRAARQAVERRFSLQAMVAAYQDLYDRQLLAAGIERKSV